MECFTHSGTPAVGICKVCNRAVCHTCAIDSGVAISCCESCAKEAADLHEMNQRGKRIYGIGVPHKLPSGVIMWLLFALLFGGFGIYQTYRYGHPEWFSLLFAAMSLFIAFLAYRRAKDIGLQC